MYSRLVNNRELTFGVSGMLYKANVLMYDHQTESLWSQVRREAVTGAMTGEKLTVLPSTLTSWEKWLSKHPQTEVLSLDTGYRRDYSQDPYAGYYKSQKGFFSFFAKDQGPEEKTMVVGVTIGEQAMAYPLELLRQIKTITDVVAQTKITLTYNSRTDRIDARADNGEELAPIVLYWFVWKEIYSDTGLYQVLD